MIYCAYNINRHPNARKNWLTSFQQQIKLFSLCCIFSCPHPDVGIHLSAIGRWFWSSIAYEGRHWFINCFPEQQKKNETMLNAIVKCIVSTEIQRNCENCILESRKFVSYHLTIDMILNLGFSNYHKHFVELYLSFIILIFIASYYVIKGHPTDHCALTNI